MLCLVRYELIPSKLLDLGLLKLGIDFSNAGFAVRKLVIHLHTLQDETAKLVLEAESKVVASLLLLHWDVGTLSFSVTELNALVNGLNVSGSSQ